MSKTDSYAPGNKVGPALISLVVCFLTTLFPLSVKADDAVITPVFEETSLTLIVDKAGNSEIPAVISGKTAYLSITGLFSYLQVKNTVSESFDTISGFFLNLSDPFLIDKSNNLIRYNGKEYHLAATDMIKTRTNLFLSTNSLKEIFGLDCKFSLKTLSVNLNSKTELPLFRKMRQEETRKYIRRLKGEVIADTVIKRKYPMFRMGTVDWAFYSTQFIDGGRYLRAYVDLGLFLAGGETEIGLNSYSNQPLMKRDLFYRWRYVNNDHKALRQVIVGKIPVQSISSIYSNVVGFQVTNTPSSYRKYFGTYRIHEKTEPGWTVELYVNNTLIDYVKADASGFFTFEVPLSYGSTEVKLRYYGPWGEEKSRQKTMLIPYTFLPKNEFEYNVSAGMIEDSTNQLFYRAGFNYGLTRTITVGGGNEYLSSIQSGKNIPYLTASFSIARNILITGEYDYGVRGKAWLSYRLPANIILELCYTNYDKDQKAINNNFREERRGSISIPVRFRNFSMFSRVSVNQIILPENLQITLSDLMISAYYKKWSGNLHTYGFFNSFGNPDVYSDIALGYRLPWGISLTPSIRYDHIKNAFTGWKCIVEKPFFRNGFFNISYEQYSNNNIRNLQIGLRYVFSFAQTSIYANQNNNTASLSVNANGSFVLDPARSYIKPSNIDKGGKGSITILPFLDINNNGKRDKGEPKVRGIRVNVLTGGIVERESKDTLTRIYDLEPYANTVLEIKSSHVENISWQLSKKIYSTTVNPNMMLLIEVPVSVVAEATGIVNTEGLGRDRRNERIKLGIYRNDSVLLSSFYAEKDGYYSYLGLKQGNYTIAPDTAQLRTLQAKSVPASRKISVSSNLNGEIVDALNFTLESLKPVAPDTTIHVDSTLKTAPVNSQDTTHSSLLPPVKTETKVVKGYYSVQVAAFLEEANAKILARKIETKLDITVKIVKMTGYYNVMLPGYKTRQEATIMLNKLEKSGYPGAYVKYIRD